MTTPYLLPLDSPAATLPVAGGKAANLARLIRAGFPVPGGFIVTTAAYDAFVAANGLAAFIRETLAGCAFDAPAALEAASAAIRAQFGAARLPDDLAAALRSAYLAQDLASVAVAVRSSATAEDLPDLSFAGQQDTFLNVVGTESLLRAVIDCWSSLWTARAIGYRARNGIAHEGASLAIAVQQMVDAEMAGVLFTANPLTGHRGETVIDAVAGLGDALVSGQVEPDHVVAETATGRVLAAQRGGRRLVQGAEEDHTSTLSIVEGDVVEGVAAEVVLSQAAISELVALGRRVQAHFGEPQDIEWAWAGGEAWLLQARPITSLYPLTEPLEAATEDLEPSLRVFASFGALQGMLDPFTPLGRDALVAAVCYFAHVVGQPVTFETQRVLRTAGERLFMDITGALRHGVGRRLIRGALSAVEPGIGVALTQLLDDPRLALTAKRFSFRTIHRAAPMVRPLAARLIGSLLRPDAVRRDAQAGVEIAIADFAARAAATTTLAERLALLDDLGRGLRDFLLPRLLPRFAVSMASLNLLLRLAGRVPGGRDLALRVTRGLPHNVTTEMDLALWQTALALRADPAAAQRLVEQDAADLAAAYQAGRLPEAAQRAVAAFLARYGMRGVGEIDLGRPRWRENPTPVFRSLQSYLQIADPARAPDAVFARGAAEAGAALEGLVTALRQTRKGWLTAHLARWAARRVRALAGLRESPKFTIINLLGAARTCLLDSGRELAAAGTLAAPADIFFLRLPELRTLSQGTPLAGPSAAERVAERRARAAREQRRRQIPRLLLSDGRAFYEGVASTPGDDAATLVGSPVSPGVVEGAVRIVLDPHHAQLQPGEILVCPGTDPAWTPLFLAAAGLVMEVGGLMTHGSVVAREYGIPAVVGVHRVTQRLQTGQRIRVNGTTGQVTVLT